MAKKKHRKVYVCSACGEVFYKWHGKCTSCGTWNSLTEQEVLGKKTSEIKENLRDFTRNVPVKLSQIPIDKEYRLLLPDEEFNRVLGGGIVPGSLLLLGGEPGIGKSTLLLQTALAAKNIKVLYVSGEESEKQVKLRAERLPRNNDEVYFLAETRLEALLEHTLELLPDLVIIDSIQTMRSEILESSPGSAVQLREITAKLMDFAKTEYISFLLVGHITKEGIIAGPKLLEHMVDAVLYFEGDRNLYFRILRSVKNRFGSVPELGIYEMSENGLVPVKNPSELFLSVRENAYSGIATLCTLQGMRSFLVEVQSLVSPSFYPSPQRSITGFPQKRLNTILAVLEKRVGLALSDKDVFVNLAGGLKIDEPAADLGIAVSLFSAFADKPISPKHVFVGEISLTGEIRPVPHLKNRVLEADRLGFQKFFTAKNTSFKIPDTLNIQVEYVSDLRELFQILEQE